VPTTYATDIRPKFRPKDLACMTPHNILLDSQSWMCDPAAAFGFADHGNARCVYERLSAQTMPPDTPWSPAWLALYQGWMTDGFLP
jgi:hypothetical protein